jgi:hypothetical protein
MKSVIVISDLIRMIIVAELQIQNNTDTSHAAHYKALVDVFTHI